MARLSRGWGLSQLLLVVGGWQSRELPADVIVQCQSRGPELEEPWLPGTSEVHTGKVPFLLTFKIYSP